jgi:tricarboxylate carrier
LANARTVLSRRVKSSDATAKVAPKTENSGVPVASSMMAAILGIGAVSAAAYLVEDVTASLVPPFHPKSQRFDQSSFLGRFSKMLLACDPRLLFYTEAQVREAQSLLQNYKDQDSSMDRTLWEAQRIVNAALHPDTGEVIPRPFRMSGYVPYNGPICVAMVASTSTPALLFWSWTNQSQNALVNFFNRNASSPMSNVTLAKSYAAAVGSALLVAFGLATFIQKKYPPAQAKALLRWVAFPSAVIASSLNCYIVRSPEIESGVPLQDSNGNIVLEGATSQIAARRGVESTTASRAILQAPVYFLPPALLSMGPLSRLVATKPSLSVPLTTFLVLTAFGLGLPATVAIFPQMSEMPVKDLEERYHHLRDPVTQQPYTTLFYNKGL